MSTKHMVPSKDREAHKKPATMVGVDMEEGLHVWKVIEQYFHDQPQALVKHHIDSFDDFYTQGIFQVFRDINPLTIVSKLENGEYKHQCRMYFGGKEGNRIYYGNPMIYDPNHTHFMFPNEARLRNMTYGMTIHYDIECEFLDVGEHDNFMNAEYIRQLAKGEIELEEVDPKNITVSSDDMFVTDHDGKRKRVKTAPSNMAKIREHHQQEKQPIHTSSNVQMRTIMLDKIFLGRFPIMLQSKRCVLGEMTRDNRWMCGECKNDLGGYFIIDGKEKVIIPQEKLADNTLNIRTWKPEEEEETTGETPKHVYVCSIDVRSVSENVSKPRRTFSIKLMAPTSSYSNLNLVCVIPNVRKPIPLFVLFRALGIVTDKAIITTCLLHLEQYEPLIDLFLPSVHDAGGILTQQSALWFIALLTKGKTIAHAHEILTDYLLPHVGESNYTHKAYYVGQMVFRMLQVHTGAELPTDRDNFKYKRVETTGSMLQDLFREYLTIQKKQYHLGFESRCYFNQEQYENALDSLVLNNYQEIVKQRVVETGFKKAFKGNWGSTAHTKRIGVIQDLNRLSFNTMISHLRKVCLPMDPSLKVVEPRLLHSSQWGFIDPLDTPDGGNIGFHKSLAISTYVSRPLPRKEMEQWLHQHFLIHDLSTTSPTSLSQLTQIWLNGFWMGSIDDPGACMEKMKLFRRNALIPILTSIAFDHKHNTIMIFTDGGRLCRPVYYVDRLSKQISANTSSSTSLSWKDMIAGSQHKKPKNFDPYLGKMYEPHELYENIGRADTPEQFTHFTKQQAIIDYVDGNETEYALIAMHPSDTQISRNPYTHCEIHESLMFGVMCNQVAFPEHNQAPRNLFSCGQSKQACSMYHTNYQVRMDKTALVLNYGQTPLVKSRYGEFIHRDEQPYGENAIVAIMCYTGYNVEDAILINRGAIDRGLFRTTYFNSYEAYEERKQTQDKSFDTLLTHPDTTPMKKKTGLSYEHLDHHGIVKEGTWVHDESVLICLSSSEDGSDKRHDCSVTPKKGQMGVVEKTFVTDGEEGERIVKVRVMEQRIPAIGDKFASRVGQKGTIGMVIPEADMPFTREGLRPDIIINPHAIPTRMTIGQIIESITGKACALLGAFGDCTAFVSRGKSAEAFGHVLNQGGGGGGGRQKHQEDVVHYHSSGNEIFYNGMTGEQIEMEVFVGPTYYMRLKHMVKDKINYRRQGDNALLTRQPVGGRANDGGLRIGEMERDSVFSHGAVAFLRESMMERADKYYMAVCNKSGMLAVYNPDKNLFMSPIVDGPLHYHISPSQPIKIDQTSRFGQDFSVVCIPYTLKLLMQELQCMNVQMRIITEDNIHQLEHLVGNKLGELTLDVTTTTLGWQKGFDETQIRPKWTHVSSQKIVYQEPAVLKQRMYILKKNSQDEYFAGDVVYYVDDTDELCDPMKEWTIDSLDKTQQQMTLRRTGETLTNLPYNLATLRLISRSTMNNDSPSPSLSPTTEQQVGDIMYGWEKLLSTKYENIPYWRDTTTLQRGSTWTEPIELVRRREILSLPTPTHAFPAGTWMYDISSWELTLDEPVTVDELNRTYQVTGNYWDYDTFSHMLTLPDKTHIPWNPSFMRVVENKPSETVGGGKRAPRLNKQPQQLSIQPPSAKNNPPIHFDVKEEISSTCSSFFPDQIVYKRGDTKPRRFWYVHRVVPGTITIATEDGEGLETQQMIHDVCEKDIQLVPLEDLNIPTATIGPDPTLTPTTMMGPGITFAPVIKVIQGNDNSTPIEPTATVSSASVGTNIPYSPNPFPSSSEPDPLPPMEQKTMGKQEGTKEESVHFIDPIMDFTKVLIKKVL